MDDLDDNASLTASDPDSDCESTCSSDDGSLISSCSTIDDEELLEEAPMPMENMAIPEQQFYDSKPYFQDFTPQYSQPSPVYHAPEPCTFQAPMPQVACAPPSKAAFSFWDVVNRYASTPAHYPVSFQHPAPLFTHIPGY